MCQSSFSRVADCYAGAGECFTRSENALPSTALRVLSSCPYPLFPRSPPPELEEAGSKESLKRRACYRHVCKRQNYRSTVERTSLGKGICSSGRYLDLSVQPLSGGRSLTVFGWICTARLSSASCSLQRRKRAGAPRGWRAWTPSCRSQTVPFIHHGGASFTITLRGCQNLDGRR